MKQITALYLTNAREFCREPMAIVLILLLPLVLAVFFGLLFEGGGGSWTLQLGIVNKDGGPAGQQFMEGLTAPDVQEAINLTTGSQSEMLAALERGDVSLVLVLPADMTASLGQGQQIAVEVLYGSASAGSSAAGLSVVQNLLDEANLALSGASRKLVMEPVSVQIKSLRNIDLQMPGLLGVALLWLGLFGTALPLVQQRTTQVLRRLSVTPLRPVTMLTAQVGWRVTVALLQAGLFLLVGYFAFQVGVVGSKLLFVGVVALGALVFISLGYLLAGLASSEEGLMGMVQLVNLPMMFLSGGLVPHEMLPGFFQPVIRVLPLTYLSDALRQLMVDAPPLYPLWLDCAVLAGCFALFLVLGVRFWRWE
ncbi:MAG TPA: ABC transporter permease [Anaerolineae bacterium]|nr:ABC transporter permease [Anaerolineae bacterium]